MKKSMNLIRSIISIVLIVLLVLADQLTKSLVNSHIELGTSVCIVNPLLYFTHVENEGAAWSILSGKQLLFIILTIVMLIVLVWFYVKTPMEKKYDPIRYCTVVLSAGAIGNFIDRVSQGRVVDFIDSRLV